MSSNYQKQYEKDYASLYERTNKLAEENRVLKHEIHLLNKRLETAAKTKEQHNIEKEKQMVKIRELTKETERLRILLNVDGTNSGTPTSKTPINKKKVIPNSRKKTGKKIGGQSGHEKHKLERFADSEVTETADHSLELCPQCNSVELQEVGKIEKDELDYKVVVTKVRHRFKVYRCSCCGAERHEKIPNHLKEENQYGPQVQALALELMNEGNVTINKVVKMLNGFTDGAIKPSEGYLVKLQKKASKAAEEFCEEVKTDLLTQKIVYWDDTVIMSNTKRACLRFYGTKQMALYKAHLHKDKAGLDEDGLLKLLSNSTTVMHDHNKVNYNSDYSFQNAECNVHLLRDLKRVEDNLKHTWATEMIKFLTVTHEECEALKRRGVKNYTPDELRANFETFDKLMLQALQENKTEEHRYYEGIERTLILRLLDYKNEYLAWMVDFEIPFTNNLSERGLRGAKSKMKASGQFQNIECAKDYANIRTYLETCHRNDVNGFYALLMVCVGNPLKFKKVIGRVDENREEGLPEDMFEEKANKYIGS
jgi:Zn finger protein HypA/HybF involved in hydrogenase expression